VSGSTETVLVAPFTCNLMSAMMSSLR